MIKRRVCLPTTYGKNNQIAEVSIVREDLFENEEVFQEVNAIWLNVERNNKRAGIQISPEEAIEIGKMLYKIAYATGYKD